MNIAFKKKNNKTFITWLQFSGQHMEIKYVQMDCNVFTVGKCPGFSLLF